MTKRTKKILGGITFVFLALQFFQIDRSNPSVDTNQDYLSLSNPPQEIATLIRQSCYDCHSNTTVYPAYTRLQPVGAWVKHHVEEGREHLNFSTWGTYEPGRAAHKLEECAEVVQSAEMPMKSYTWMHAKARLSAEQRSALATWFNSSYQQAGSSNTTNSPKIQGGGREQESSHEENEAHENH